MFILLSQHLQVEFEVLNGVRSLVKERFEGRVNVSNELVRGYLGHEIRIIERGL